MEIKAELKQPYSNTDRMDFIVKYNHGLGYEIEETETALVAKGYTDEEMQEQERERIAMLNMTGADVERAIYQVKGIDFDDILEMAKQAPEIDVKALKIELKANNFYRGNPYIDQIGTMLGFTSEMLDKFFDTKDYRYLTTCTLTVNATPEECSVVGAGAYPYGTTVDVTVKCDGYESYTTTILLTEDKTVEVVLEKTVEEEKEVIDDNTTDTTE